MARDVEGLPGYVLNRDDAGFDEAARTWNARLQSSPETVVRCRSATDVAEAVEYARRHDVVLSIKGGGHSYGGKTVAGGGILIDLGPMDSVVVEPAAATARVGPGVTWGGFDHAAQEHGLATTGATVSSVGVAGYTLGGGTGWLARAYGLAADNLIGAEVVTADGRIRRIDESDEPELFWALRGAGSNFGVVTSFQFRVHPVGPPVLGGQVIYPFDEAASLLRFYRDFMATAPDEFQCYPFMFRVPPVEPFPEEFHGQPVIDFVVYHLDPDAGEVIRPFRDLGSPILDVVGPLPYVDLQQSFDANLPAGQRYYSKSHDYAVLSDETIDAVVEYVPQMKGELTAAYFEAMGGAVARVAPTATAFPGRDTAFGFHLLAGWMDPAADGEVMAWAREFHDAMAGSATGGVYVNLLGEDEDDRVPAAYGANYDRLVRLKSEWDPTNLFRSNYNIPPV